MGQGAKTMPISTAAKKEAAAGAKVATGMGPPKGGATAKVAGMGGGVSEEEAKALLRQSGPIKSQDLVAKFKSRLKTQEVCLSSLSSHCCTMFQLCACKHHNLLLTDSIPQWREEKVKVVCVVGQCALQNCHMEHKLHCSKVFKQ